MKTYLAALLLAFSVLAQAQSTSSLTGVVTDSSGAVVPGAEIVVVNSETNQKRTASADSQGRYSFPQMQPSVYEVSAHATGFSEVVVRGVHLLVNTPSTVDIRFEVGAVQQSVAVSAETVQVNTQDATIGNAVGTRPILPSKNHRDGDRSSEPLQPDILRIGLLIAHSPAGQQALVEDRATAARTRLLPAL